MRVLHIFQKDDPDAGGGLRVAEALVREQRAAGLDARLLFLYGDKGEISAALGEGISTLGIRSSRQVVRGVAGLVRAIRSIAPDLLHSHDGIMWPRLAYGLTGVPVVTHGHLPPETTGGLKQKIGWPLVRSTTKKVIGISGHTAEQWKVAGFPDEHIEVIPNGVDFNRFSILPRSQKKALRQTLGLPEEKQIMVWVGRLQRSMKGTDRVERIADCIPDSAVLVVVGHGPEYEGMQARCADAIASGRLILAGSVARPEQYYMAADVFLFSSHHEPFGLVLLEAVASGLPIFYFPLTGGGGAAELLERFGAVALSEAVDADELQRNLNRIEEFSDQTVGLREEAAAYSWQAISADVVRLYESLLEEAGR